MATFVLISALLLFHGVFCSKSPMDLRDQALHKNLNNFAFKFHNALSMIRGKGNLFFSPYSIATAMAMVRAGTNGKTRNEIDKAMGWDNNTDVDDVFGRLLKRMTAKSARLGTMNVANRIWVDHSVSVKSKFRKIVQEFYHSKAAKTDFKNDPEFSRRKINDWVKKNTGNQIVNFLKRGMVDWMTKLVVTNAIYFKAVWKTPFNPEKTRKRRFYTTADKYFRVKMMEAEMMTKFAENSQFSVLELPYKGKKFSMIIVLPDKSKTIKDVEKIMDADTLINMKYRTARFHVFFPKFKLTSTNNLKGGLSSLNITSLFGPDCDLSAMLKRPDGIFLTQAIHKAFIEVDERGTRAGAATALITGRTFLPSFNVNRPFLFYIKDNLSNVILFSGRYVHP